MHCIKTLVLVATLFASSLAFAGGGESTSIGTSKVVLGTPNTVPRGTSWVTGTAYLQGQVVRADGRSYFALAAGTSGATAPRGEFDVSDGTVTWRPVLSKPRKLLFLANLGDDPVTFSFGDRAAVYGVGFVLEGGDKWAFSGDDVPQTIVTVISDGTVTNAIASFEL